MRTTARKTYTFSAAHWIPTVAHDHKCYQMHGHTYRVTIEVGGYNQETGMCVEFERLDSIVGTALGELDHTVLNTANKALDVPTVEVISRYLFARLRGEANLVSVSVREGEGGEAMTTDEADGR